MEVVGRGVEKVWNNIWNSMRRWFAYGWIARFFKKTNIKRIKLEEKDIYILLTFQGCKQIFILRPTLVLYIVTFWVLKNTADDVTYMPFSGTHQAYIFSRVLSQLLTVWAQGWVWLQSFYLQAPSRYDVSHVFISKFLTKILQ